MQRNKKGHFIKGTNGNTYEGFGVWCCEKRYPTICRNGKAVRLHVYVWEKQNGKKPKGFYLHHIDFDKNNYCLDNLELLSQSDHQKLHAGWIRKNDKWILKLCKGCNTLLPLDKFYPRKGLTPSSHCIKCTATEYKAKKVLEDDFIINQMIRR